jgi:hypothetical protein
MQVTKTKRTIMILATLLLIAALPVAALAGSDSNGGITLNFPDNAIDCNPTFKITTEGVDPSWPVQWDLFASEGGVLVRIGSGSTSGNLDVSFTPDPLAAGETQVYAVFVAVFVPGQELPTKLSGKWRVDCEKEPGGGEGCTPGFWKTHLEVWPINPNTTFDSIFGRPAFDDATMAAVVNLNGGQLNALGRHAAAAYLNAVSGVVNYDMTAAEVIAAFQAAYDSGDYNTTKNMFEALNELGCPY